MIPKLIMETTTEAGKLRAAVWKEALEWRETPWVHHHMLKGVGTDCIGMIVGVGKNVGVLEFDWSMKKAQPYKGYTRTPNPHKMRSGLASFFVPTKESEMNIGDVLWFKIDDEPQHVGILGPKRLFVHAEMIPRPHFPNGKVVCSTMNFSQGAKLMAVFRYPRIDEALKEQWQHSA